MLLCISLSRRKSYFLIYVTLFRFPSAKSDKINASSLGVLFPVLWRHCIVLHGAEWNINTSPAFHFSHLLMARSDTAPDSIHFIFNGVMVLPAPETWVLRWECGRRFVMCASPVNLPSGGLAALNRRYASLHLVIWTQPTWDKIQKTQLEFARYETTSRSTKSTSKTDPSTEWSSFRRVKNQLLHLFFCQQLVFNQKR